MAFNDVSETANHDRDVFEGLEEMTDNRARYTELMLDAQTSVLQTLAMNWLEAVCKGLGHIAPVADPIGADLPELKHRIGDIHGVDEWLFHRKHTVGDRYGGKGWHEPYERYGMSTAEESLAALKARRSAELEYKTEEYDLDAANAPTRAKRHGMPRPGYGAVSPSSLMATRLSPSSRGPVCR